jgi:hypothetical protein
MMSDRRAPLAEVAKARTAAVHQAEVDGSQPR